MQEHKGSLILAFKKSMHECKQITGKLLCAAATKSEDDKPITKI